MMRIEGTVVEVYETWPLQLSIEAADGLYHIGLNPDTKIKRRGHPAGAMEIKDHVRIAIYGTISGPKALLADSIELL